MKSRGLSKVFEKDNMEIWVVRHATTQANMDGRFQGRREFPLSEQGRREAGLLSERLKEVVFTAVYCSPMSRARETAEAILRNREQDICYLPLIQEYSWGIIEGCTAKEVEDKYPELAENIKKGWWHAAVPGKESKRRFFARIKATRTRICANLSAGDRVLLISHGRFINGFMCYMVGLNLNERWVLSPQPASISILQKNQGEELYKLKLFNDRCHLDQAKQEYF